jgi:outer membrane protein assembly factor BamB
MLFSNSRWLPFVLSLTCLSPAWSGDWPQWRGPDRTGHVPADAAVPTELPAEPEVTWKIEIGEGLASPIVADGTVFYFDNRDDKETLHAIDAQSAEEKWKVEVDNVFRDNQGPPGPRSTPMVDGDRIYAVSCRGELQCRQVENGDLIWRTSFTNDFSAVFIGETGNIKGASRHGNNGTPLIVGDRLYVCVGGTDGEGIVCFNKHDGTVIWKSQNDRAAYAPPVMATLAGKRQLIGYTVDGLLGLDPEGGRLLWRVPMSSPYGRHVITPIVREDLVVTSSHLAGMLAARVTTDGKDFSADEAWVNKESAINFSHPVAVGDYLYGIGPNKNLMCVQISTGKQQWSQQGHFISSAGKAYAGFIVMHGNILMLTDGGLLVLFEAKPDEYREIGRAQVCGFNWCNPAYANGRFYLRDGLKSQGYLYSVYLLP